MVERKTTEASAVESLPWTVTPRKRYGFHHEAGYCFFNNHQCIMLDVSHMVGIPGDINAVLGTHRYFATNGVAVKVSADSFMHR